MPPEHCSKQSISCSTSRSSHTKHPLPCPLTTVQENVAMMDEYIPLSQFKAVYIVDLCHSLCEQVGAAEWISRHCADHPTNQIPTS